MEFCALIDLKKANHRLQGRLDFQGLNISIENRKGSVRSGIDKDGHKWSTKMAHAYGRIIGIKRQGQDGEKLDCFVGPNKDSQKVFIVHINHADSGKFDEDKCYLGFGSKDEVMASFRKHYDKAGQKLFGGVSSLDMSAFKKRLEVQSEGMIKSLRDIDLKKANLIEAKKGDTDVVMLRKALAAELDAINLYEEMALLVKDREVRATMLDIAKEEKAHVGEFQRLLIKLDGQQGEELEHGAEEVEERSGFCSRDSE